MEEKVGGSSEEDEEEEGMYIDMGIKEEEDGENSHDGILMEGHQTQTQTQQGKRCRPKEEKERTKLRERHRRAITARILAGLRRHGNYNLRIRADINDVIGALAREAGWTVFPDGTTIPSQSTVQTRRPITQIPPLQTVSPCDMRSQPYHMKEVYVPPTSSLNMSSECCRKKGMGSGERVGSVENSPLVEGHLVGNGVKQLNDMSSKEQERDFTGTSYVPVFVMLPLGIINLKCELINPDALLKNLRLLKSINIDGVMVGCWWGIVEAHAPQNYNWNGYYQLFQIARDVKLKIKVAMSFHECGGNVGDDVCIPLPRWVEEIGRSNPDIYFTDREGRRNTECLTWGIDKERVLRGRTAVEVYYDFMRSFRVELDGFFEDGVISDIEIGLGPCGELRYPSCPTKNGWRYPGIGEFQCYDQYLLKSLRKAARDRGHSWLAKGPDNAGTYNSQPHETGFFCDGGEYERYYGRFFLKWYSQVLLDHADRVLYMAKLVFEGTFIAAKLSGIHWWYKTASHAAELIAGFYNPSIRDGYSSVAAILRAHKTTLNFACTIDQHENFPEAMSDPEGLVWQVLNAAWDASIAVSSENTFPCYDRNGYNKILENAKPYDNPDGRHLAAFTYLRLSPVLMNRENFLEFERFVKKIHGVVIDNQV